MNEELKALKCKNVAKTDCPNRFQPPILNAAILAGGTQKIINASLSFWDVEQINKLCHECLDYVAV